MINSNILELIITASKIVLRGDNYSEHFLKIRGLTVEHFYSSAKKQSKNHYRLNSSDSNIHLNNIQCPVPVSQRALCLLYRGQSVSMPQYANSSFYTVLRNSKAHRRSFSRKNSMENVRPSRIDHYTVVTAGSVHTDPNDSHSDDHEQALYSVHCQGVVQAILLRRRYHSAAITLPVNTSKAVRPSSSQTKVTTSTSN
jgi:hypothetical protein